MGDSTFCLAVAILVIAFHGEPDLVDAIIHYLMAAR